MSFVGKAWCGKEKLWKVFWLYGVIFYILLTILSPLLLGVYPKASMVLGGIGLVYALWIAKSLWSSAFNVRWSVLGYLTRTFVLLLFVVLPLAMLGISVFEVQGVISKRTTERAADMESAKDTLSHLAPEDAPIKAKCDQTLTDYALKKHEDPLKFIAENQFALGKCIEFYKMQKAASQVVVPLISKQADAPQESTAPVQASIAQSSGAADKRKDCEELAKHYNNMSAGTLAAQKRRQAILRDCQNMQ